MVYPLYCFSLNWRVRLHALHTHRRSGSLFFCDGEDVSNCREGWGSDCCPPPQPFVAYTADYSFRVGRIQSPLLFLMLGCDSQPDTAELSKASIVEGIGHVLLLLCVGGGLRMPPGSSTVGRVWPCPRIDTQVSRRSCAGTKILPSRQSWQPSDRNWPTCASRCFVRRR